MEISVELVGCPYNMVACFRAKAIIYVMAWKSHSIISVVIYWVHRIVLL